MKAGPVLLMGPNDMKLCMSDQAAFKTPSQAVIRVQKSPCEPSSAAALKKATDISRAVPQGLWISSLLLIICCHLLVLIPALQPPPDHHFHSCGFHRQACTERFLDI